jgi:hypothetical protein
VHIWKKKKQGMHTIPCFFFLVNMQTQRGALTLTGGKSTQRPTRANLEP